MIVTVKSSGRVYFAPSGPYKLQILEDFIATFNIYSFIWHLVSEIGTLKPIKTVKFD